ncbi:hypothetical protein ACVS9Z_001547 [Cronobacter dublinensis]|uniref:Uncharacterized protein n=1 Tax=Cronobacter dublinensis 1210 TaxID=1208656 RepID=A0ABM9Q8E7_9ENTR|nr:hypothetical protein [Cronobacter dublinensis]CCJ81759.1 FIG00553804: hypothetical protein [Cronobacter dublinensis 1210]ALB66908.1 hypothetical protein AFK67_10585 [Cronobacter dublinensis subsp. dublinensis LMG 23823]EGT4378657.1 hypothetical protein [Cronobacter dublinensis]EKM6459507.1 hypothetical protein [Cronobacter dublinensis]EKP4476247.1 hypothetical protein [Cronobacter dublinensis]
MPSVQLHLKDRPEVDFTATYSVSEPDSVTGETIKTFEVGKAQQINEFSTLSQGEIISVVLPSGEAQEVLLTDETDDTWIFSSRTA